MGEIMLFFGSYEHNLDNKNRVMLPSKFRSMIKGNLFCMTGFEGCLSLYTEDDFNKLSQKLSQYSFNSKAEREYIRTIYASVIELEIDKVGRILLPTSIVNKYGIPKTVSIIGVGDHLEIWDTNKWNEYNKNSEKNFDMIAEELK
ncbi:MAG: division/cell wall cluster transcriptional repressor MraZ [Firmicutes bacterium]|nr:division/cell wall cluster transcriptional repressor MraZ [Candidatus Alectryobacillus merdavium]